MGQCLWRVLMLLHTWSIVVNSAIASSLGGVEVGRYKASVASRFAAAAKSRPLSRAVAAVIAAITAAIVVVVQKTILPLFLDRLAQAEGAGRSFRPPPQFFTSSSSICSSCRAFLHLFLDLLSHHPSYFPVSLQPPAPARTTAAVVWVSFLLLLFGWSSFLLLVCSVGPPPSTLCFFFFPACLFVLLGVVFYSFILLPLCYLIVLFFFILLPLALDVYALN